MSYPSNSFTSSGAPDQSGRYIVPAQAIQSAVSTHQHKSTRIGEGIRTSALHSFIQSLDKVARGDKLAEAHMELQVATDAFARGQMTWAEFDIVLRRINDFGCAHDRHLADYLTREQAGKTKRGDLYKEFYGYTDEEAEEHLRQRDRCLEIERANEARSQSRMLHRDQGRHGRGH